MPLAVAHLDPDIVASIRHDAERVIVKTTEHGFQLGVRSIGLYTMANCLGRMTITDTGEVYHSLLGSVPVYNARELAEETIKARRQWEALLEAAIQLDRNPHPNP